MIDHDYTFKEIFIYMILYIVMKSNNYISGEAFFALEVVYSLSQQLQFPASSCSFHRDLHGSYKRS